MKLRTFINECVKKYNVVERAADEGKQHPNAPTIGRYLERMLPPAGWRYAPLQDLRDEEDLAPSVIYFLCKKLLLNPKDFGVMLS